MPFNRKRVPGWRSAKEATCSAGDSGDMGSASGLGRAPGVRNGNPLLYSCLQNPIDTGATVHRVAKSQTQLKRQNAHMHNYWLPWWLRQ